MILSSLFQECFCWILWLEIGTFFSFFHDFLLNYLWLEKSLQNRCMNWLLILYLLFLVEFRLRDYESFALPFLWYHRSLNNLKNFQNLFVCFFKYFTYFPLISDSNILDCSLFEHFIYLPFGLNDSYSFASFGMSGEFKHYFSHYLWLDLSFCKVRWPHFRAFCIQLNFHDFISPI